MILGDLFKNFFKYLFLVILCLVPVVILGAGVYCGVYMYKEKTSVSQTYGELNKHDLYEDFNVFDCDLSNAIFYQTVTGYEYTTTIPKAVEFNGNTSKYNVLVNDQPSINEQSSAGILTAKNTINYYGIDGNEINQTVLTIEFKFYQSKVEISIKNANTAEQQALFLEYIAFNGLKIRTIEAQYVPTVSTSEYYTITFLGKDGEQISISRVAKGGTITAPEPPKYAGYDFAGWSPTLPIYATQNQIFTATYTEIKPVIRVIVNNQVMTTISREEIEEEMKIFKEAYAETTGYSYTDFLPGSLISCWILSGEDEDDVVVGVYNFTIEKSLFQNCYDFVWTTKGNQISNTIDGKEVTCQLTSHTNKARVMFVDNEQIIVIAIEKPFYLDF